MREKTDSQIRESVLKKACDYFLSSLGCKSACANTVTLKTVM